MFEAWSCLDLADDDDNEDGVGLSETAGTYLNHPGRPSLSVQMSGGICRLCSLLGPGRGSLCGPGIKTLATGPAKRRLISTQPGRLQSPVAAAGELDFGGIHSVPFIKTVLLTAAAVFAMSRHQSRGAGPEAELSSAFMDSLCYLGKCLTSLDLTLFLPVMRVLD